ncbi:MAG: zinc-ribbon domain-containing protein, partial [Candidatus Limnocylindrales bacterium]
MTYTDRTLTCVDCGVEFIHSAADQEFYEQKGFVSDPKRCTSCRASRRASRDSGTDTDLRDIGGPRGYERG